jgi:hypothetical protein
MHNSVSNDLVWPFRLIKFSLDQFRETRTYLATPIRRSSIISSTAFYPLFWTNTAAPRSDLDVLRVLAAGGSKAAQLSSGAC